MGGWGWGGGGGAVENVKIDGVLIKLETISTFSPAYDHDFAKLFKILSSFFCLFLHNKIIKSSPIDRYRKTIITAKADYFDNTHCLPPLPGSPTCPYLPHSLHPSLRLPPKKLMITTSLVPFIQYISFVRVPFVYVFNLFVSYCIFTRR